MAGSILQSKTLIEYNCIKYKNGILQQGAQKCDHF